MNQSYKNITLNGSVNIYEKGWKLQQIGYQIEPSSKCIIVGFCF